jgi:lipopolysaccharide/colanic/teichoic acid biosynthesis glycosyltransferase
LVGPRRGRRSVRGRGPRAVVVHAADRPARLDETAGELQIVRRLELPLAEPEVRAVITRHSPRLLLVAAPLERVEPWLVAMCHANNVRMLVMAEPVYGLLRPVRLRRIGGHLWLSLRRPPSRLSELAKRLADVALIVVALPVSVPLLGLITLMTAVSGPPLYVQLRVGARGRVFRMVKFRTMRPDAERETGAVLSVANDHRVTRVGRVLRRLRLDELPQLWNVLLGHMSLVGPRPERPEFVDVHRALPAYELRHLVRPGLTGVAQLTGGYSATVEDKLQCDLFYLHCRSSRMDLALLGLTAVEFVRGFPRG